jgi:hypothetical protein
VKERNITKSQDVKICGQIQENIDITGFDEKQQEKDRNEVEVTAEDNLKYIRNGS